MLVTFPYSRFAAGPYSRFAAAVLVALAFSIAFAPEALAKRAVLGPVSLDVPDDFKDVGTKTPAMHQDASGITIEASPLPPQALHEFKGPAFLDYLKSLGFTDPTYADGGLKRTDAYTYVLADAKGAQGPEKRFLLVIGGTGGAAIITAYALESEIANGHASRAAIEAILNTVAIGSGAATP